jgi:O-antigen/teichoic acid export membrane protein
VSIKKNIVINHLSQIYVTAIGIACVPIYIKYMGVEAYGLVGFFVMLQAWFSLLDIGLTPTISRETSRFLGGSIDKNGYRNLIRTLESILLVLALVGGTALYGISDYLAQGWLNAMQLPTSEIKTSLKIMSMIIVLRWMSGLYRGVISGSERLVWLSSFNSIINTIRFVGVIPILIFIGSTPSIFFSFQLLIAIVEFLGIMSYTYILLPKLPIGTKISFDWIAIKKLIKFSLTIACTSSLWVVVTQTDKLILSRLLPLNDYGYYTLAVIVSSAVLIMSGPVGSVLMPRMAIMEVENKHEELIKLYRKSTQFICVLALPVACTLAVFAEQILWAWTGDLHIAKAAAPVMQLYVLGNAVLALSALPYYLQYAKGDLRLHLFGSVLFTLLLLPTLVWGTLNYGAVGAGWAWLAAHLISFFLWIPIIHCRIVPGLHVKWLIQDIAPIVIIVALFTLLYSSINFNTQNRAYLFMFSVLLGILMQLFAALGSKAIRTSLNQLKKSRSNE